MKTHKVTSNYILLHMPNYLCGLNILSYLYFYTSIFVYSCPPEEGQAWMGKMQRRISFGINKVLKIKKILFHFLLFCLFLYFILLLCNLA